MSNRINVCGISNEIINKLKKRYPTRSLSGAVKEELYRSLGKKK